MADNVQTTFGQFATSDIGGGLQAQYVKLMDGTAGSSTKIAGDAANGLDVDVTRVGGAGATPYRNLDLGLVGQVVKATPGKIVSLVVSNQNAAKRYLKVYDKATAPTEADAPKLTYVLQPASTQVLVDQVAGLAFAAGISLRASAAIADADIGAPAANDVVVSLGFF